MPKKLELREGDAITVTGKVTRASEDGETITIEVWGQKITGPVDMLLIVEHEKGHGWPE